MKKALSLLLVAVISFFISINVNAYEYSELPVDVQNTFKGFVFYLNKCSEKVYDYIDSSNIELKNNVQMYLGDITLDNEILDVTNISNNNYKIEASIDANGGNWNVSGFKIYYEIKLIDEKYKIVDTNLFEFIGSDNILDMVTKIFIIVGGILLSIFVVVLIIVVIILMRTRKKKIVTNQTNSVQGQNL